MEEKISVLITNYNNENFVSVALQSVIDQTYQNWEVIIVDDCSSDKSVDVIKNFLHDPRISLIINKKNEGCGYSSKVCANKAKGRIMAILNSDDALRRDALQVISEAYKKNPLSSIIYSTYYECNSNLEIEGITKWVKDYDSETTEIKKPQVSHFLTFKKSVYDKTEGFDEDLKTAVDRDLILKLEEKATPKFINIPLYYYRMHDKGISQGKDKFDVLCNHTFSKLKAYKRRKSSNIVNLKDFEIIDELLERFYGAFSRNKYKVSFKIYSKLFNYQYFPLNKIIKSSIKFPVALFFIYFLDFLLLLFFRPKKLVCFFSVYHIGGAEKVHADIMSCVKTEKPIMFFVNRSKNMRYKKRFMKYGRVIDISLLIKKNHFFYFIFQKAIIKSLNKYNNLVILGCNNAFFYNIVAHLKSNFRIVDIIHAFGGGSESYSLHSVPMISKRVIISKHLFSLLKEQYENYSNDFVKYLKNITYIQNKVDVPNNLAEKKFNNFNILYLGRNSQEKNLDLMAEIIYLSKNNNSKIKSIWAGDWFEGFNEKYNGCIEILGPIYDDKKINILYENAHVVLVTSKSEGFPMMLMEAMGRGVVPVVLDVGGISIHVKNEFNGIVITEKNEEKIIQKMSEAIIELSQDKQKFLRLSKNAYDYAKKYFQNKDFCKKYYNVLFN